MNKLGSLIIITVLMVLGACTSPAKKFDQTAASLGLQRAVVLGAGFQHVLFWQNGGQNKSLHVYLGGDGTPIHAGHPSDDPTPRAPLILQLLALDPGPAVHVGRPCYHGLAETNGCTDDLWTNARYSERVVSSLASVIRRVVDLRRYNKISFIGYSGGGTLAMLLAERFPDSYFVVTIAANLDIDAWTDHHDQPRLTGSLNPITHLPLHDSVLQRHYTGSRDHIVPPAITARGVRGPTAKLINIDHYNHVCCWSEIWPSILMDITAH